MKTDEIFPRFSLLLNIFIMGALIILLDSHSSLAAPTVTINVPSADGDTLSEVDEFATTIMGDPWDMAQPSDLTRYRADSGMVNSTFSNGIYSATMPTGQGGEKITLLKAGAPNHTSLRIGKIGYNYPINADEYRYLTFRIYKSCTSCNSGLIEWYSEDTYTDAVKGISNSYSLPATADWHTITIDLQSIGIQRGQQNWSGFIRDLAIHPFAGADAAGAIVKLDWARLTAEDPSTSQPYTIDWTNGSGVSNYDIYASPGNNTFDSNDILMASNVDGIAGSYTLQAGVLPSGSYYIGIDTGSGISWSPGTLTLNAPPQVSISKPSKTSGEEYSASVLGDAWDMEQNDDLNDSLPIGWETCVSNPTFTGIYSAVLTGCSIDNVYTDARFVLGHMNTPGVFDPTIDTDTFRYLSYHYSLDGQQNVEQGWVSRFGWWQQGANGNTSQEIVMSRDVVLDEDWNTYKLDLWADDIVDEAHSVQRSWLNSAPNRLRFDPAELYLSLLPNDLQLDWIKLTAMDEVQQGELFLIEYEITDSQDVNLTFYYDVDTNPDNGRSLIDTVFVPAAVHSLSISPANANDTYFIFLPVIMNNTYNCTGDCYVWDTTAVAPETYYICIEAQDLYNTTYQCSEAPVIVRD
ncbi:MAG: hypothetical protein GY796_29585 [Chloroflexi bacterium]|nr:hypothetical protein [Chloroflexota bacterium]